MKSHSLVSRVLLLAGLIAGSGLNSLWAAEGPPTITTQPASQRVFIGDPATFTVGVDGTAPFAYQWLRSGAPVDLATSASYTIPSTTLGDDGAMLSVIVTNSLGAITSEVAVLTIDQGMVVSNSITTVPINAVWRYNQSGADLGTAWKEVAYNDSVAGWSSGPGVFDAKSTPRTTIAGETVGTQLSLGVQPAVNDTTNYYFRTHFNFTNTNALGVSLTLNLLNDDGAAIYLNGQELQRIGLDAGAGAATWANRTVGDAGYEFFTVPATALINGDNVLAAEAHQINLTSSDITFGLSLQVSFVTRERDTVAPTVSYLPEANSTVRALPQIEVRFSEGVQGVDAADLLVNNVPATELLLLGPDQYVFRFPSPPNGTVQVSWASGHGITDLSANSNAFTGASFTYILDPNANFGDVRINEFMAANDSGIVDEDGDTEDWVELFNAGSTAVDLAGWYLTDNAFNLRLWQFPTNGAVTMQPGGYLIVWASEKNKRVPGAPLHTNFKLEKNGEYLTLVLPDGSNVVSSFSPRYPAQFDDVSYGRDRIDPSLLTYFSTPTPGAINSATGAGLGVGPEVKFSRKSGTFRTAFNLELSVPSSNFVIRYFLVTNAATAQTVDVPSATSPIYTGPIPVSVSTQVRARAYPTTPGYFAGPAGSETYLQIDAGAAAFTSDLPVIIYHNFGGGIPPSTITAANAVGVFMVFDTNNPTALTSLTNPPVLATRAGAHIRGSSTEGFAKRNLGIELWTEVNRDDRNEEVLGMPADSDWVLYAPNQFDRNYLHNPVAYALGRQMGHWAPRTRFAEFFFNTAGGMVTYPVAITAGNYNGIYVLMEKIKVMNDRLNIARLDAQDTNATTITGGYTMKIDRANDADDVNNFTPGAWTAGVFPWITANHAGWNTQPIIFHDPDGTLIGQRPLQRNWFINYINTFEAALRGASWTNAVTGYRAYIDEDQWIDNHMLNIFPFNVDGYRLSGYFYKERDEAGFPNSGKLKQGPLWDFDRSQGTGSVDPRPFNPRQWKRPISGDQGTDLFGNNDNTTGTRLGVRWWWHMFHDPDFWQRWVDRWQELRETPVWSTTNVVALLNDSAKDTPPSSWNTTNVLALIDALANQVRQAQPRNAARWTSGDSIGTPNTGTHTADGYSHTFTGTYQGDVDFLKKWWTDRLDFVETNFLRRPVLSNRGGQVPSGHVVTVTAPGVRAGTVTYYTLDGTDPRLPGGAINPAALTATAPFTVTINQNTRLFARNRNPNHSNPTNASLTAIGGNPPISTPWSGTTIATYVVDMPPLRIAEIMYDPFDVPGNTNDPGIYEYVELVNVSGSTLNLIGFQFTNGIQFKFTATNSVTSLATGGRVLVVKNRAAFLSRYPGLAAQVAGEFSGSLNNAGERLALLGPLWELIHDFRYENTWYPATEGLGFSLVPVDENAALNTWTNQTQWRASAYNGGSPGVPDAEAATVPVVLVNELLAHSVAGYDVVELFNPNPDPVDVGNWYLTDNRNQPQKYRIPADTIIPGNGYRLFYESNSFGVAGVTNAYGDASGFGFSSSGEEVYLFSGDSIGRLTGYLQGFDFGPAALGVSFGRYTNSVGTVMEVAQSVNSLEEVNAGPMVGPLVINEIMAYPPELLVSGVLTDNFRDEFIEVRNISGEEVLLYDTAFPANRWQIEQAADFKFPIGASLPPNGYLLVVGFDPVFETAALSAFRARYNLSESVPIYGPFDGHLANEGERLELRRPGTVNPGTGVAPMVLVDRVDYLPTNPWPVTANGTGAGLQRVNSSAFGNDPANWIAAGPSPGTEPVAGDPPVITVPPQPLTVVEESTAVFAVTVTGTAPLLYQWFLNGVPIDGAYSSTLTLDNVQLGQAGEYSVFVLNGSGTVLSGNALLTVRPLPVITLHPSSTNMTLTAGVPTNVTLRVAATGTGTLLYQWQFNDVDIPGATSTAYIITNGQPQDSGVYRALVTDTIGTRASLPATVNFSIRPVIIQQPQGLTLLSGQDAVYTVAASGTTPMGFRWRRNAATITNGQGGFVIEDEQTNSTLTQVGVTYLNDFDRISVVVNNLAGSAPVSSNALLRVLYPPVLTAEPTNFLANAGTNVTFRALFRANPEASYSWWFNETNLLFSRAGVVATNVNGTNVSLVVSNVQTANEGLYTLTVSNEYGLTTSTGAVLALRKPPTIVTQPQSQTASPGADVTFSVEVTGTAPLRYVWKFNGTNLPGATNATLELANVQVAQAGDYRVVVTNTLGSATSDVATLTVQVSPALTGVNYDVATGKMQFSVATTVGVTYRVEYKDDLAATEWQPLQTIVGDGTVVLIEDPVAAAPSQRFYQIRVQ